MTDSDDNAAGDGTFQPPSWDREAILRERAKQAHADRDAAVNELRKELSEDEILSELGLYLRQLED